MADGSQRVAWTLGARDGLDEALAYIAEDSPAAAARMLDIVLHAADSLEVLAARGRVVPEIGDESVREIFVFSYRVVYEVMGDSIRVLAFVCQGPRVTSDAGFASVLARRIRSVASIPWEPADSPASVGTALPPRPLRPRGRAAGSLNSASLSIDVEHHQLMNRPLDRVPGIPVA